MLSFRSTVVVLCVGVILAVAAVPTASNTATAADASAAELVQSIDQLDQEQTLSLFGGLSVDRVGDAGAAGAARSASESVLERVDRYLQSHTLNFSLKEEDATVAEARSSKVKKILLPLLLALKLKLALVLPIVLKAITLISLKGLAAGTIALLFSGATFVKDLLAKKQEHITTAYISGAGAQPVNAEFVHHHGNEWNRNGQAAAAQDLAYNYHTLPQYV